MADTTPLPSQTALALTRTPRLRKARISGYRRSIRSGDGVSTLAFDAYSFGEWSGEEVVKGVVFEAANLDEERELIRYVGGTGEVKTVEMEVACSSLLGKVGKMMRMRGRIFVPEGDGDTLVGSMRSFVYGEGRPEQEEMDMVVRNDRPAAVNGHPTPRISPSIASLNDADVPHRSLDELSSAAVDESLTPQTHEHPADPKIETVDWAATKEVETTQTKDIKDTKLYKELMEMQEPKKVEVVEESGDVETMQFKDIKDTKVFKAIMETKESEKVDTTGEAQKTTKTTETEEHNDMEIKDIDDIDEGTDTQVKTEYQWFLLAEHRRSRAVSMNTFISNTSTKVDGEGSVPASATPQPWSPSTPWRKEYAKAPVRPAAASLSPSHFSGTTTQMRKTSDSIKSLVDKFENMTPRNTPSKGA